MKQAKWIAILLVLAFFLAGCGERVNHRSIKTSQMNIKYPQVSGMKDGSLQKKINSGIYLTALNLKDEYAFQVEIYKNSFTYTVVYEITLHTKHLLGMRFVECLNMPFYAHPINKVCTRTINMRNGSVYALADLFEPGSKWNETLNSIIKEKIQRNAILLLKEFKSIDKDQEFYLTKGCLAIYWQEAEYLPRYLGPFTVLIERSKLSEILRKDIIF